MAFVSANGVRLKVMDLDGPGRSGPPVVMLHGIVIDNLSSLYFTLANHVAAEHRVVLYDLRGHGRSDRPPTGYRIADAVDDLDGLLAALGIDEPVVLVGNSFGGAIALAFAAAHPGRTAGLVLIEAHFAVAGWGGRMADMLGRAAALAHEGLALEGTVRSTGRLPTDSLVGLGTVGLSADEVAFVRGWIEGNGLRKALTMARTVTGLVDGTSIVDDLAAERPVPDAVLEAIAAPSLVVYGADSDIVERGRDLGRLLPCSELVVVEGHDHSVLMSAPEIVLAHLLPWLAAQGGRADRADGLAARSGGAGRSTRDALLSGTG